MGIKRESCDKWFSDVVRQKSGYVCEHCERNDIGMDCAHIHGRRAKSVRWSLDNAVCLCRVCHMNFTSNPVDFTRWLENHVGSAHLEILNEKRNALLKTNKQLRLEIAKHYREEHERMLADVEYIPISYN